MRGTLLELRLGVARLSRQMLHSLCSELKYDYKDFQGFENYKGTRVRHGIEARRGVAAGSCSAILIG